MLPYMPDVEDDVPKECGEQLGLLKVDDSWLPGCCCIPRSRRQKSQVKKEISPPTGSSCRPPAVREHRAAGGRSVSTAVTVGDDHRKSQ
jgi:hypothetical protein